MIFEKPFVHYLAAVRPGPHILPIRELSPDEFDAFRFHCNTIIQYYNDQQTYFVTLLNYKSFTSAIDELGKQCSDNAGKTPSMIGAILLATSINRHLMNFLSAFRTFLDHTETNLKRRHGTNSERLAAFEAATSNAFDSSISYRFLSQLRNYVQHCGMPVGKMSIHVDFDEEKNQPVSQYLELLFSRDLLLSNFKGWHKMVMPDLEAMPEYFPIRPHIDDMMVQIDDIQRAVIVAESPSMLISFQWLDKLMLEATWRGGIPTVACRRPCGEEPDDDVIELADFPVGMMDIIRRPLLKHFGVGPAQFFA